MRYPNNPVRVHITTKNGIRRTYEGGYHLIAKYRNEGRLICAFSTSTGRVIADASR